ncbi:MAG: radical SAM family heme chaperone HemW [Thermodesulfovibrionales bacterium]|jgi:oxygen-independent coproporphyrinogen-3 oxidase
MVRSLYIHIPFCIRKCSYCDFYSLPFDSSLAEGYSRALIREMELRSGEASDLATVYLGGGTPTMLSAGRIRDLMESIRERFSLTPGAEVTIEANPRTLSPEKAEGLLEAGINRISIGVQSFNDAELLALGRSHNTGDALRAVEIAQKSGFTAISLDLMYGLPGQGMPEWEQSLAVALELGPVHISAYELTPEEGTPLHAGLSRGEITIPGEETIEEMYHRTIDMLAARGYRHYEISNFALPGHECRHNLNYWERGEYLGVGAGAHSFIDGVRMENVRDLEAYLNAVGNGAVPRCGEMAISADEAVRELLFLGLRKTEGIAMNLLPRELRGGMEKAMEELVLHGLVSLTGDRLRLTRRGLLLSNSVIVRALLCTDNFLPSQ